MASAALYATAPQTGRRMGKRGAEVASGMAPPSYADRGEVAPGVDGKGEPFGPVIADAVEDDVQSPVENAAFVCVALPCDA